jgi:hypothetical protein
MKLYDFTAIILIPLILFHFIIDYLSDSNITKDETKIGILQFIHQIIVTIVFNTAVFSLFLLKDIKYTTFCIILLTGIQIGFLINNDRCWYTKMVNKMTGTSENRKWVSNLPSFIMYYTRGAEWANSDISPRFNYKYELPVCNMGYILILLKFLI